MALPHPIQHPLQYYRRRQPIHPLRPLRPAQIRLQHRPLRLRRGQPFVPEDHRPSRLLREVALERPGGLGARAFGAVHVEGQADDEQDDVFGLRQRHDLRHIRLELAALDGAARRGDAAGGVAGGEADGLGTQVESHQALARLQFGASGAGGVEETGHGGRLSGVAWETP
jgi:hypothetical protein